MQRKVINYSNFVEYYFVTIFFGEELIYYYAKIK